MVLVIILITIYALVSLKNLHQLEEIPTEHDLFFLSLVDNTISLLCNV